MNDLFEQVRQGRQRAIARLITLVENDDRAAQETVAALYPHTGQARVVGITGPPGSGKSTLVNGLALHYHQLGFRVGVVAVDPSSPFTGGALLGDRVRMSDLANHPGLFVRSMASRGNLGGLAQTTAAVVKILDAAGYNLIVVETVGAGQAEVDIAATAHTIVVVEAPGMGDEVQSIKAGILEIADVLVVNKADRPGVQRTVSALEMMLHMGSTIPLGHHGRFADPVSADTDASEQWEVVVLQTVAAENRGLSELAARIDAHEQYLRDTGEWLKREERRSRQEIDRIMQARFAALIEEAIGRGERESMVTAVARRDVSPYDAANELFQLMGFGDSN